MKRVHSGLILPRAYLHTIEPGNPSRLLLYTSCGIVYTIDTSVDSSRVGYYYTVDISIPITYTYSLKISLLIN